MAKRTARSNARREPYRIQAARINLELALELGKPLDARIIEVAKRRLSASDPYDIETILAKDKARLVG